MSDEKTISEKYKKLTQREHILSKPTMYIGSISPMEIEGWKLNPARDQMIISQLKFNPGLYKLFDELVVNSLDESYLDPNLTEIKVFINREKISVFNNGKGIPVIKHQKYQIYIGELIFGTLLTSTHYDQKKIIAGGTYGLGAKIVNIMSSYFVVEIGDPVRKLSFKQSFKNNMGEKSKPEINKYDNKDGYVKITYIPDFKRFKVKEYSKEDIDQIIKRTYEIAGLSGEKISVYLNGNKIKISDFTDLVKLYIQDNKFIREANKTWEVIVSQSDETFRQVSFVNGINTFNGGRHVTYILNQIIKYVKDYIERKHKIDVRESFIKDQLYLFVRCNIENPAFSSQTKDELITSTKNFSSFLDLSEKFFKNLIKDLPLVQNIVDLIKARSALKLKKLSVRKTKKLYIDKLDDANFAGGPKSYLCTLVLTEGDSAKSTAISGIGGLGPSGRDFFGVFPLKGKLLNVRDASSKQIGENEEFKNLRKIMGLQIGAKYDAEKIKELRYGKILLMMDADVDGSHIKGLFINAIDHFWPSLLKIKGFLQMLVTPIVKVSKGKETISFYSLKEYNAWYQDTDVSRWRIKYYKGLGTNTVEEAREYFKHLNKYSVDLIYVDKRDNEAINLAFSKKQIEGRKKWLKSYDKDNVLEDKQDLTYRDFINKELIHFSNSDNLRSIPNLIDGLKPSQRKILYAGFKKRLDSDSKVSQFVGYVSEQTSYHHGETSLMEAIIGMAQNFVGSNNLNVYVPSGQFGTRLAGGKDHASARYIFTRLRKIAKKIFHPDDSEILTYLDDDGYPIEPEYYVPIIPMILVNGTEGIGTGYSTSVPLYNPNELIENLINKIKLNQKWKKLEPWYQGFIGNIEKISQTSYVTKGKYQILNGKYLEISELPIGSWTNNYKVFLEKIIEVYQKKLISSYTNNSTESKVYFLLKIADISKIRSMEKIVDDRGINQIEKVFKLTKYLNTSNMYLYDEDVKMKKYDKVEHILDYFYRIRLEYYQKRKDHMLKKLRYEYMVLESKVRFIKGIVEKKITVSGKTKDQIISFLEKEKFFKAENEYNYLIYMPIFSLTKEKVIDLEEDYEKKKDEYQELIKKKIENIWLEDLSELKKALD